MSAVPVTTFAELAVGCEFDVSYCPWCHGKHRVRVLRHEKHENCDDECLFAAFEILEGKVRGHGENLGQPECQMKHQLKTPRLFRIELPVGVAS